MAITREQVVRVLAGGTVVAGAVGAKAVSDTEVDGVADSVMSIQAAAGVLIAAVIVGWNKIKAILGL